MLIEHAEDNELVFVRQGGGEGSVAVSPDEAKADSLRYCRPFSGLRAGHLAVGGLVGGECFPLSLLLGWLRLPRHLLIPVGALRLPDDSEGIQGRQEAAVGRSCRLSGRTRRAILRHWGKEITNR